MHPPRTTLQPNRLFMRPAWPILGAVYGLFVVVLCLVTGHVLDSMLTGAGLLLVRLAIGHALHGRTAPPRA